VSVGRATALDEFNQQYFDLSHHNMFDASIDYLGFPDATYNDSQLIDNGILPAVDSFNLEFDHMVGQHSNGADSFDIGEFLHHDLDSTQCASSETQFESEFTEKTSSLQPPNGASLDGCDSGSNAVTV
jgi:transcriptional activator HAC1